MSAPITPSTQRVGTMSFIPVKVDGKNYVIMHQRAKKTVVNGIRTYSGPYSLAGPGGVVNSGETPEDAIVREAVQEYGLDVTICSVRDSKVLAETNDRLLDGSFWRRKWYLLQLTDTKQVPRIPALAKKTGKADHMVAVEASALLRLAETVTSGGDHEANEHRIKIELNSGTVYFFESYKNLAEQCPRFWKDQFPKLWDLVPNMPNYQVVQLLKLGYDIIE